MASLRSASATVRFTRKRFPVERVPISTRSGESQSWFSTRYFANTAFPTVCLVSSSLMGRWVPVATTMVMPDAGTPRRSSSARSGGSIPADGVDRVISFTIIAAVFGLFAATISSREGPAVGCFRSRATSAGRFSTGLPPEGSRTARTFSSGIERETVSFPHLRSTFIIAPSHLSA